MKLQNIVPILGRAGQTRDTLVERATAEAETGRRLAIYDRQTGLYAYWYLVLRFEEEAHRAKRYCRPLSVIVIQAKQDQAYRIQDEVRDWLHREMRATDLASHLGDGCFLALLTESSLDDAGATATRLAERFADAVEIGLSAYPDDGTSLDDLRTYALRRAHGNWALAV